MQQLNEPGLPPGLVSPAHSSISGVACARLGFTPTLDDSIMYSFMSGLWSAVYHFSDNARPTTIDYIDYVNVVYNIYATTDLG